MMFQLYCLESLAAARGSEGSSRLSSASKLAKKKAIPEKPPTVRKINYVVEFSAINLPARAKAPRSVKQGHTWATPCAKLVTREELAWLRS